MTAFPRDAPLPRGGHEKHADVETYEAAPSGSKKPRAPPLAAAHDTVSWISRLFFCWVNPVTSRCLDSSIRAELLPPLSTADETELKRGALDDLLCREETKARHPSIFRATLRHFWPALLTATLWSVFRELLSFASTFLLKDLLADDEKGGPRAWQRGLIVAGGLSGVQLLLVFLDSHLDFYSCRIMIRVETALLTSLYKRILSTGSGEDVPSICIRRPSSRLSSSPLNTTHSRLSEKGEEASDRQRMEGEPAHKGALFNVIFVDIPSAAEMVLTALDLIIMPLRISLAVILLVVQVGAACVPGVLTLFLIIVCTVSLTAYNATLKIPFMRTRDARLERSHECLKEMRTVRLLGWEDIAEDLVNKRREKEMGWISFRMFLAGVSYWLTSVAELQIAYLHLSWALNYTDLILVVIACTLACDLIIVACVVLQAPSMRPDLVIPVIHMMDVFVGPLTDLPYSISTVIEGQISLKRLQRYFFRAQQAAIRDASEKAAGRGSQEKEAESQPLLSEKGNGGEGEMPEEQAEAESRKNELLGTATAIAEAIRDPELKVRFLDASFCWKSSTCAYPGASVKAEKNGGSVVISRERVDGGNAALNHITLDVKCGQVVLITGPPGSGKTTLLQSILQQDSLALTSGAQYIYRGCKMRELNAENILEGLNGAKSKDLSARAPIGYVPQDPWLCGGTIRENIIFGNVFNLPLYNKVVKACELSKDFASWRNGDLRVIDEGGLDLSGGQRVRVNIARAAYGCKMHQMRMNAEREEGEKEEERHQQHLLTCLVKAVAAEDRSSGEVLDELKKGILCEPEKIKQKSSFSCLLCFDECFNNLDLSVAGHVFHNLFGPSGLLTDCAVVLCLNKSSLLGLLHQHAGQEGFHTHRKERTPQEGGDGNSPEAGASTRMQFTICTLAEGSITWRGGINDFIGINEGFRPSGEAGTSAATIENLLAVNAPCKEEDEFPGSEKGESKVDGLPPSGSSVDMRTLAVAEHGATGRVQAASYFWYLKHTGRLLCVFFFVIVTLGSMCDVAGDLWLSKWTAFQPTDENLSASSISSAPLNILKERVAQEGQWSARLSHRRFLCIFACIAAANLVFELLEKTVGVVGSVRAARSLHQHLWAGVCNAPLWFYDQNPLGRILNRFATDVSIVDGGILRRIGYAFVAAVSFVLSVFVLSLACKWVIPFWPFMLAAIYLFVFRYFRSTSREVQRASLMSFSPLCSCFSEAISGNAVICSLQKQHFFLRDMTHHLDLCQRTKQMQWGISSWSSIRIELMLFPLVIFNSTLPGFLSYEGNSHSPGQDLASNDQSNIGLIGLAISYSISIAGALRRFLSNVTNMEKEMCSVERIQSYLTETEYQRLGPAFQHPHPLMSGVARGRGGSEVQSSVLPFKRTGLLIQKVEVRYRAINSEEASALKPPAELADMPRLSAQQQERQSAEDEKADDIEANQVEALQNDREQAFFLKPSIRDLSAEVKPGEHIGIVGRTGAGKSTLLQALYGLLPCHKGAILLDGIRIDCLPRQVLRNVVGFLPQRSIVFEGWTVRDVLDPRRQHDDLTLWEALRVVGLDTAIASLPGGAELDTVLVGEGSEQEKRKGKRGRISAKSFFKQNAHPLSAQQLRYLALGRLVADAPKLRLVLIDEPPAEEIWNQASFKDGGDEDSGVPTAGAAEIPPLARARSITDIIAAHFQQASVIVVAHHLSSLRGCDRVWVLADGRKVGECNPTEIDTEQKFNSFVAACTEQPQ